MTGPDDLGSADDAALTPAQEAQVRRLLAQARHDEPMPADVVARLDGVLAALTADTADEQPQPEAAGRVVLLDDVRRRRRRASGLLVAAAAVAVVGVGVPRLLAGTGADKAAPTTAADNAEAGQGGATELDPTGDPDREPRATTSDSPGPTAERARLQPKRLKSQLASAFADGGLDYSLTDGRETDALVGCPRLDAWGRGRVTPVLYDDQPAALVVRRPRDGEITVDVYQCGALTPIRTVTLPTP